jgi:O-antigen ligase
MTRNDMRKVTPYLDAYKRINARPTGLVRDRICLGAIEYGLLGILVFSPLPAASVNEWSRLVIELAALLMLGAYAAMATRPSVHPLLEEAVGKPRLLIIWLFLFWLIQFIPFPKAIVRLLSPGAYNFRALYSLDFSKVRFLSFSLIPSVTFQRGLEILTYFLIGFLVFKTVSGRRQIQRLLVALTAVGAFEAVYGFFELHRKNPHILFYRKVDNLDSVTGTFVNRNHFSGFLEMIIPLAIGLLISRIDFSYARRAGWRKRILRFSEKGLAGNLFLLFAIILMSLGVAYSKSRSGVFILIFTFILFVGLMTIFSGMSSIPQKKIRSALRAVFLLIIAMCLYLGMDATLQRFSLDKILREGRPTYWAKTLMMFADRPLFGSGLGTFGYLYPPMEGENGPVYLEHAHNDYLEYLAELGFLGFIPLLGGILFIVVISFLAWRTRKSPEVAGLALGGLISVANILLHSLTDFNLHIPANMVLFSIVLPLTMVLAFHKLQVPRKEDFS